MLEVPTETVPTCNRRADLPALMRLLKLLYERQAALEAEGRELAAEHHALGVALGLVG